MKRMLVFLVFAGIISSCKKSAPVVPVIPTEENFVEPDIDVTVIKPGLEKHGSADYDVLGYGYDETEGHDRIEAVRVPVIDINLLTANFPWLPSIYPGSSGWGDVSLGADAAAFVKDATYGIGKYLPAKSVTAYFPEKDALSKKYVYGSSSYTLTRRTLWIASPGSQLKNCVTAAFRKDLTTMDAPALVEKYGTHILTKINVGVKITAIYQAKTTSKDPSAAVKSGLMYSVKTVLGGLPVFSDDSGLERRTISSPRMIVEVVGGDVNTVNPIIVKGTPKVVLNDWNKSYTADNAKFVGVVKGDDGTQIIPIYEVVDDPVKRDELKTYIENYLSSKQLRLID